MWWNALPDEVKKRLRVTQLQIAVGVFVLFFLFVFFWGVPALQLRTHVDGFESVKEYYELQNNVRATFAQAVGGAALLAGLFFTWRSVRIAQEGQITDRFTKAVSQLGESEPGKLAVRLGGIYALERIARDSPRDHWPIMEILTAYIREHAPRPQQEREQGLLKRPTLTPDLLAILTVIGRRTWEYEIQEGEARQRLDLTYTELNWVNFEGAHLRGAILGGAMIAGAIFRRADLRGANFGLASVHSADFRGADLRGAAFITAQLHSTKFQKADLRGADLRLATGLERELLEGALIDSTTQLPDDLKS